MRSPRRGALVHIAVSILSVLILLLSSVGCGEDEVGIQPPNDQLYYPLGVAPHPDGRYLYISNAVFDRAYNTSTIMVLDTFTQRFLPEATIEIGLFAGELSVVKRACSAEESEGGRGDEGRGDEEGGDEECEDQVFGFVASRDNNQFTTFQVNAELGDQPKHLQCGQASADSEDPQASRQCLSPWVQTNTQTGLMSRSPYGIHVDGEGLFMTHIERGVLSRWRFLDLSGDRSQGASNVPVFNCQLNMTGARFVAQHPSTKSAFISHHLSSNLQVVNQTSTLNGSCRLSVDQEVKTDLANKQILAFDNRGLAFSADGTQMYLANGHADAVFIYDTSVKSNGKPRNSILSKLHVGAEANMVRVAGLRPDEGRLNNGLVQGVAQAQVDALGGGLVYVTSFQDNKVVVIDPKRLVVMAQIDVGQKPHDIAFLPDANGKLRGYVSNFQEHSISVIDLDPSSPTYFKSIATIR